MSMHWANALHALKIYWTRIHRCPEYNSETSPSEYGTKTVNSNITFREQAFKIELSFSVGTCACCTIVTTGKEKKTINVFHRLIKFL